MHAIPATESLLVFSDVHLGSDLNDSGPRVPRSIAIDDDLAALIAHYRALPPRPHADRWHLVIAGDFIDFVGMSIDPPEGDELATEPTAAERAFGLGGAEDHVRHKLRRAAARHPRVFAELGRFVAAGHALTLIHGNHDLELHWDSVKTDFCELIARAGELDACAICERVQFSPWFFYREGLAYIEHGHQYDPFCATPYILAPLSPRDLRRVAASVSDSLLRYVVRRTPGMREYGHEERGLVSYVAWGFFLGGRGGMRLVQRFFAVVRELFRTARSYASEAAAVVRAENERRLRELARAMKLPEEKLRRALALHAKPMVLTASGVLASVMLDRLGLYVVMTVMLGAVWVFRQALGGAALPVAVALVVLWAILHVVFSRGRPNIDPGAVMITRARELAKLFPASFVVMGHTHVPVATRVGEAIYVNLGSWAEEEPDPKTGANAYRAARTHLVIHDKGGRHEARLFEWRSGEGPREIESLVQPHTADAAGGRGGGV